MVYQQTLPFSKQFDENGQEKKLQRTKIVLQRLKFEDLLEDPPATKVRKVQSNTKVNTEKIKFVPTRMKFTEADFEDTPPCNKTKAKQQKGRTKTARKELFCNSRKSSAKKTSTKSSTRTTKRVKPKIVPNLDNTEFLMDISEAEADLIKKPHIVFKKPFSCAVTSKPKQTPITILSKRASLNHKTSTTKKMSKSPKLPDNLPVTETKPQPSLNSSENSEFLDLEEQCRITDDTAKQVLNIDMLVPPTILITPVKTNFKLIPNEGNTDLHYKIFKILQKQQEDFDRLKKQFEDYQYKYSENVKQIENLLKTSNKENRNISPEIPRLENLRVSTLRKRFKRSVTFNTSPVKNDENAVPHVKSSLDSAANPFEDIKLQKAANLYNSMRLNYSSILSTPKFEKSCLLQTPKSVKSAGKGKQRDSISTKLQKQCWLLQDTPIRK